MNIRINRKVFEWIAGLFVVILIIALLLLGISNRSYAGNIISKYDSYLNAWDTMVKSSCNEITPAFLDMINNSGITEQEITYNNLQNFFSTEECRKGIQSEDNITAIKGEIRQAAIDEFNNGMSRRAWYYKVTDFVGCNYAPDFLGACSSNKVLRHYNSN